jgi:hypothetical protein
MCSSPVVARLLSNCSHSLQSSATLWFYFVTRFLIKRWWTLLDSNQ